MKTKHPLLALAGALLATVGGACDSHGPPEPAATVVPPGRLVLVVVDTLRRDALGIYGARAKTPNIDRLAREGQYFERAVAAYHQTTMSMGGLFTGRTPSIESGDPAESLPWEAMTWCGMARFDPESRRTECLPPQVATLGEEMRRAGYETIGIVSNPLLFDPYGLSRGFDGWTEVGTVPESGRAVEIVEALATRNAIAVDDAVATALDGRASDHFFLYVHYMDVHDYGLQPAPDVARPGYRWSQLHMQYRQSVEAADRGIGRLLDRLDDRGLLDGSVVVVTSDHGERLGDPHFIGGQPTHIGNPSFEELLEVPLIVWPAQIEDTTRLVRGVDVFRMLLELAGRRPEVDVGLALDEVFTSEMAWVTYRRGRFKSYSRRRDRGLWLVDLAQDESESRNVAAEHPDVSAEHRARIDALADDLAAASSARGLSADDAARLRALGYMDPTDADPRTVPPASSEPERK